MTAPFNRQVVTPLGVGMCQGDFSELIPGTTNEGEHFTLVRHAVAEVPADALGAANCLTPNANDSGLWIFAPDAVEVKR